MPFILRPVPAEGSISVLDYPSNDKDLTLRYPFIRTFEWVPVRGYFYLREEDCHGDQLLFYEQE